MHERIGIMYIALFDDEDFFCKHLENIIENFFDEYFPNIDRSIHSFNNTIEFSEHLSRFPAEIVFLDIATKENENCGFDLAKKVRELNENTHIIFTTTRTDKIYECLEGFIRPTQFLMKPIKKEKITPLLKQIVDRKINSDKYIIVKFGRCDYLLNVDEIYLIEKDDRKTCVNLINRKIEVTNTLVSILKHLPEYFVLIEKGVIVNLKMVSDIDFSKRLLYLTNGSTTYMSRSSKQVVREFWDNYRRTYVCME